MQKRGGRDWQAAAPMQERGGAGFSHAPPSFDRSAVARPSAAASLQFDAVFDEECERRGEEPTLGYGKCSPDGQKPRQLGGWQEVDDGARGPPAQPGAGGRGLWSAYTRHAEPPPAHIEPPAPQSDSSLQGDSPISRARLGLGPAFDAPRPSSPPMIDSQYGSFIEAAAAGEPHAAAALQAPAAASEYANKTTQTAAGARRASLLSSRFSSRRWKLHRPSSWLAAGKNAPPGARRHEWTRYASAVRDLLHRAKQL